LGCAVVPLNVQQPIGPVKFILNNVVRSLDQFLIPVVSPEVLQLVARVKDYV